jgi:hypothetical protein
MYTYKCDKYILTYIYIHTLKYFINLYRWRWRSRYNNLLWSGRPRGRSSSPDRVNNFQLSISSRPALGPTHFHIQYVTRALSWELKRPRRATEHSPTPLKLIYFHFLSLKSNSEKAVHQLSCEWERNKTPLTFHVSNINVLYRKYDIIEFGHPLPYTSSEWLGCKRSSCDRFFTNVAGSSCASKARELACPRIQKAGDAAHARTPILERPLLRHPYTHYWYSHVRGMNTPDKTRQLPPRPASQIPYWRTDDPQSWFIGRLHTSLWQYVRCPNWLSVVSVSEFGKNGLKELDWLHPETCLF